VIGGFHASIGDACRLNSQWMVLYYQKINRVGTSEAGIFLLSGTSLSLMCQ
jgi:hypothetical protein